MRYSSNIGGGLNARPAWGEDAVASKSIDEPRAYHVHRGVLIAATRPPVA
jgi:hypothetical protein